MLCAVIYEWSNSVASNINPSVLSLFGIKTPAARLATPVTSVPKPEVPRTALTRVEPDQVVVLEYNGVRYGAVGLTEAQLPELERQRLEIDASNKKVIKTARRLLNGEINPLSDEASNYVSVYRDIAARQGILFEGRFTEVAFGAADTAGYAQFIDRQTAMMNAYYYTSNLTSDVLGYAGLANRAKSESAGGDGAVGGGEDAARYKRAVDRRTQLLAAQFGSPPQALATDADGRISRQGFELTHDRFGKILSVDDKGVFTFYDAAGTAYDAAAYVAAAPDGIIPQLVNHENYRAGKLDGRF